MLQNCVYLDQCMLQSRKKNENKLYHQIPKQEDYHTTIPFLFLNFSSIKYIVETQWNNEDQVETSDKHITNIFIGKMLFL